MNYVDFNDEKIPLGKRKKAYIAYLIKQGHELINAQRLANKRFGFEVKYPKLVFVYADYGRSSQNSYTGTREVSNGFEDYTKRAGRIEYHKVDDINSPQTDALCKEYKAKGWKVIKTAIYA